MKCEIGTDISQSVVFTPCWSIGCQQIFSMQPARFQAIQPCFILVFPGIFISCLPIPGLPSHLHLFFNSRSPGPQWSTYSMSSQLSSSLLQQSFSRFPVVYSFHVFPAIFISSSTVVLQVPSGLPIPGLPSYLHLFFNSRSTGPQWSTYSMSSQLSSSLLQQSFSRSPVVYLFHVFPAIFISSSTVLLQVPSGLPIPCLPSYLHLFFNSRSPGPQWSTYSMSSQLSSSLLKQSFSRSLLVCLFSFSR